MLLSASLIVSCHHLGCLRTNNVLFIFQISILIHRTNVQMHMYNLKTKPQVFRSVFWSWFVWFFLVEMRREGRCECIDWFCVQLIFLH